MRTILLGDVIAVARALLAVSPIGRPELLHDIVNQTDVAHRFSKRLFKPHPTWGNGSLMARANLEPQVAEPFLADIAYLQALQLVIDALIARKARRQGASLPIKQKLGHTL